MSFMLLKKAFENITFKIFQVILKQYQQFMNYLNHNKVNLLI